MVNRGLVIGRSERELSSDQIDALHSDLHRHPSLVDRLGRQVINIRLVDNRFHIISKTKFLIINF